MSKRDIQLYINDIIDSANAIDEFISEDFGVDAQIVWDLTKQELSVLRLKIEELKSLSFPA